MAFPSDGLEPKHLAHSAGKVINQPPSPAFYQPFNRNLGARPQTIIEEDL